MTHFNSPALYQPELPHSVALVRSVLAALAIALTAAAWGALGAQAGRHDPLEDTVQVRLPPVVVSGHREYADGTALALVSTRAGVDCANPSAFPMFGGRNGVNLKQ